MTVWGATAKGSKDYAKTQLVNGCKEKAGVLEDSHTRLQGSGKHRRNIENKGRSGGFKKKKPVP